MEVATECSGVREVEALAASQVDAACRSRALAVLAKEFFAVCEMEAARRRHVEVTEPASRGGATAVCRGVEA
jgi:hypothetical protein